MSHALLQGIVWTREAKTNEGKKTQTMASVENDDGTVTYGIVGVGMMGREHLINLYHLRSQNVGVVAIADPHVPSQQLAVELAQSFGWHLEVLKSIITPHLSTNANHHPPFLWTNIEVT